MSGCIAQCLRSMLTPVKGTTMQPFLIKTSSESDAESDLNQMLNLMLNLKSEWEQEGDHETCTNLKKAPPTGGA